ncbi:hypothetical protein B0H19DRAFT_1187611 [Mycena capillaripes]|nr:hypothetical protein B0H19DRAFT_1187611 [Mycena capillaripes]
MAPWWGAASGAGAVARVVAPAGVWASAPCLCHAGVRRVREAVGAGASTTTPQRLSRTLTPRVRSSGAIYSRRLIHPEGKAVSKRSWIQSEVLQVVSRSVVEFARY